jgi:gentisate 1,2-dioxygenase
MQSLHGEMIGFADYLKRAAQPRTSPVIWRSDLLSQQPDNGDVTERGVVALVDPSNGGITIAPGLSCTIQVVPSGGRTRAHAHSFWHLYFVRAGAGHVFFESDDDASPLSAGDIIFIPAWCTHAIVSAGEGGPLVMIALQNLPFLSIEGTLARREEGGDVHIVYAE